MSIFFGHIIKLNKQDLSDALTAFFLVGFVGVSPGVLFAGIPGLSGHLISSPAVPSLAPGGAA